MKIAIASMGRHACGRLDCATELIVINMEAKEKPTHQSLDITGWPSRGRADRLSELGIGVLVCGAVCRFDEAGFDRTGTRLIAGVRGPVDRIVEAVLAGTIVENEDYWEDDTTQRVRRCRRGRGGGDGGGRRRRCDGNRSENVDNDA